MPTTLQQSPCLRIVHALQSQQSSSSKLFLQEPASAKPKTSFADRAFTASTLPPISGSLSILSTRPEVAQIATKVATPMPMTAGFSSVSSHLACRRCGQHDRHQQKTALAGEPSANWYSAQQ